VGEITKLKTQAETRLTNQRTECKRVLNVIKDGKADAGLVKLIDEGSLEQVEVLLNQYNAELNEKFPATCKDCNSTNVSRNSAKPEEKLPGQGGQGGTKLTNQDIDKEFINNSKKSTFFDGE